MLDYDAFRRQQEAARAEGRYLGIGTCTYVEPTTSGMALHGTEGATIRIEPTGKVNVYVAGGSAGNSLETTVDPADRRRARRGHRRRPHHPGRHRAHAVRRRDRRQPQRLDDRRCDRVRRPRSCATGSPRSRPTVLEAAPDDIELVDGGRASVSGTPSPSVTLAEIADLAYFGNRTSSRPTSRWASRPAPGTAPSRSASGRTPPTCARARSTSTPARSTLLRYIVSEDCGPMINPNVVEGQIAGGTVQGIGGVLLEHFAYDEDGNPLATTFMDYLLPDRRPRCRSSSTATSRRIRPGPGRLQGRRRGRRDRRAAGRGERGRRRAGAVRRRRSPACRSRPAAIVDLIDEAGRRSERPVKPAPFDYHAPPTTIDGVSSCWPSWATTPRCSPAGRASSRCWRCASPSSTTSSTSAGVDELRGIERARRTPVDRRRHHPGRRSSASPRSPGAVPLLARATPLIGHFQIRNRGTIGGSLAHADPAAEYPAVALALDAELEASSPRGRRDDPGRRVLHRHLDDRARRPTSCSPASTFPVWTGRCGFAIEEVARRHGDFAIAGAAVAVELDADDRDPPCAIGLFGLGSTPVRATAAEAAVLGAPVGRRRRRRRSGGGRWSRPRRRSRPTCTASADYRRRRSAPTWSPGPGRAPIEEARRDVMIRRSQRASVNGDAPARPRSPPRLTLADFLRERCGLTGTHLGCEHGVCGACTVLLDGEAVRSCLVFAVQADGAEVTTIEGIAGARRRAVAGAGGVPRPARPAVRVLHARLRRVGHRVPARQPRPDRRRDPRGPVRQPLPLHRLPGDHRRRARRGRLGSHAVSGPTAVKPTRRERLLASAFTRMQALPAPTSEYTITRDVPIPIRDGVTLARRHPRADRSGQGHGARPIALRVRDLHRPR